MDNAKNYIQAFETQLEKFSDTSKPAEIVVFEEMPAIEEEQENFESKPNVLIQAYVDNPCYLCKKTFASPSTLIHHMSKTHQVILKPRQASKNRPASYKYQFNSKKSFGKQYRTLFGCPSCWFHCRKDFGRMEQHINEAHLDEYGTDEETPDDDEDCTLDDEKDAPQEDSKSFYMIAQLDELSARFKSMFGYSTK